MIKISGTKIKMTRGDTLRVQVNLTRDGEAYEPAQGDTVRFAMRPAGLNATQTEYANPICIDKTIPNDTMILELEPSDTAELGFGKYVYDIEVTFADGAVDTPIASASLTLTPEVATNGTD